MKRGVITFSRAEQTIIHTLLCDFVPQLTSLQKKFEPQGEFDSIEMSQDEVELILDQLPIPSQEEPDALTHIRTLLSSFLSPVK